MSRVRLARIGDEERAVVLQFYSVVAVGWIWRMALRYDGRADTKGYRGPFSTGNVQLPDGVEL